MAKKATAKKTAAKQGTASKTKTTGGSKDAKAFVDFIHKDKKARATIRKGWDEVVRAGKQQGYKFTKQELKDHLKQRYNVTTLEEGDEPDTCICI